MPGMSGVSAEAAEGVSTAPGRCASCRMLATPIGVGFEASRLTPLDGIRFISVNGGRRTELCFPRLSGSASMLASGEATEPGLGGASALASNDRALGEEAATGGVAEFPAGRTAESLRPAEYILPPASSVSANWWTASPTLARFCWARTTTRYPPQRQSQSATIPATIGTQKGRLAADASSSPVVSPTSGTSKTPYELKLIVSTSTVPEARTRVPAFSSHSNVSLLYRCTARRFPAAGVMLTANTSVTGVRNCCPDGVKDKTADASVIFAAFAVGTGGGSDTTWTATMMSKGTAPAATTTPCPDKSITRVSVVALTDAAAADTPSMTSGAGVDATGIAGAVVTTGAIVVATGISGAGVLSDSRYARYSVSLSAAVSVTGGASGGASGATVVMLETVMLSPPTSADGSAAIASVISASAVTPTDAVTSPAVESCENALHPAAVQARILAWYVPPPSSPVTSADTAVPETVRFPSDKPPLTGV
mmetsp:Transcript_30398/g.72286  ORF Transcript_30398/g.72286 Transcript_30398/m.72286 type:complete len:481 (-) Transcript_30398:205-1647(-)